MGRDLHDGYSNFIHAVQVEFDGLSSLNTEHVADFIGCKKGHALRVMRAIVMVEKGTMKEIKGRFWLSTEGDFTAEELAGWVQTHRAKEKYGAPAKQEEQSGPVYDSFQEGIIKVLEDHETRIAELERKLRSQYAEPKEVRKRRFFGLFA